MSITGSLNTQRTAIPEEKCESDETIWQEEDHSHLLMNPWLNVAKHRVLKIIYQKQTGKSLAYSLQDLFETSGSF